jgi:two-component system cell cycle response regulator DivK
MPTAEAEMAMGDEVIGKGSIPKILVVEDNQDNRELVAKVLKFKGYQVIEAVDGEEAIEKARSETPALILLDIYLPKMDGYEVAKSLKGDRGLKGIQVIALTAHAMKGNREQALAAGCDGYISKPIDIRELPKQIEQFLKPNT